MRTAPIVGERLAGCPNTLKINRPDFGSNTSLLFRTETIFSQVRPVVGSSNDAGRRSYRRTDNRPLKRPYFLSCSSDWLDIFTGSVWAQEKSICSHLVGSIDVAQFLVNFLVRSQYIHHLTKVSADKYQQPIQPEQNIKERCEHHKFARRERSANAHRMEWHQRETANECGDEAEAGNRMGLDICGCARAAAAFENRPAKGPQTILRRNASWMGK